jgi:hypothetical protein
MALLTISPLLIAQNSTEQAKQAPVFSVVMAFLTLIVLILGIIIQKRWRD